MVATGRNILIVDDERTLTKVENFVTYLDFLVYARNLEDARMRLLLDYKYHWSKVYLDHDLGWGKVSTITKIIEELAYSQVLFNVDEFIIHSANPVGRAEMYAALHKFYNVRFARAEDLI